MFTLKTIIYIRQFFHRKKESFKKPPPGILFPGIDRQIADFDVLHCVLYFANYFFYRFGIEVKIIFL